MRLVTGGVAIDGPARVLRPDDMVIDGLYAAIAAARRRPATEIAV